MAKTVFQIKPKLSEEAKRALPVQDFSPEKILEIVQQTAPPLPSSPPREKQKNATRKAQPRVTKPKSAPQDSADSKKPQGRPRREVVVKRISSDLPADLYDKVQQEIKAQGYTLNGFLAKVLREHFARQNG